MQDDDSVPPHKLLAELQAYVPRVTVLVAVVIETIITDSISMLVAPFHYCMTCDSESPGI